MRILVTGITGSIGSALAPRLLSDGHQLRGLTRRRSDQLEPGLVPGGVELVTGDMTTGAGLAEALDGVEVAYYLIHSMEPAATGDFATRELAAVHRFVAAAQAAGVRRAVYLGGLVPETGALSEHLRSRLAVEDALHSGLPDSVAFRASIVIGARSRSFRFLVRLVERMPVMLIPAWRLHRTAPVDERDVIECLARGATARFPLPADGSAGPSPDLTGASPDIAGRSLDIAGRSLDIAGPEVVTYGALIERIRDQLLLRRAVVNIPRLSATPFASRVAAVIAGETHELIGPLMEGLATDLLPRHPTAPELMHVRAHSLDRAIERALRDWEAVEELRAW